MLHGKNAVIYGAGGSLGSAIALAMAKAGARLFLTGRSIARLEPIAKEIRMAGGQAEVAVVDAFEAGAIVGHLEEMRRIAGTVDISFNAVGIAVRQSVSLVDLPVDQFVDPVTQTLRTRFLTAVSAAQFMRQQGRGVILTLTATPGGIGYPYTGGFAAACAAVESFARNLAAEEGPYGVRVVNIRSGGSPDSAVFADAIEKYPEEMKVVLAKMKADTMLKELPLMKDVAQAAVFLSSDQAARITGVTLDVTAGTTAGLNYRSERSRS
jgi:NAD(P)-dependent dehydrogenase (short-subunit alcohol dehydrogenase family)